MHYTEGVPSPPLFRLWAAITGVGGALERRCFVETRAGVLFPNLFTLLVGAPGTGKDMAIVPMTELWRAAVHPTYRTRAFCVAPDSVTRAALVDAVAASPYKPNGHIEPLYHCLLVSAPEFGVLLSAHDLEFLSILNSLFNSPRVYVERRRHSFGPDKQELTIVNPQITILGGTQPGFMASMLPEEAWSMGFTSRLIMVYASAAPVVDVLGVDTPAQAQSRKDEFKALAAALGQMATLSGRFTLTEAADALLRRWQADGWKPVPEHSKLAHYNARRSLHTLKLAAISAVSRTCSLTIDAEDIGRARDWLLGAEALMPDVFREMTGKSDSAVINDMHFFMFSLHAKDKKPVHVSRLMYFLQGRVPSEKVMRIIEIAERANMIARVAGTSDQYIPRARHEWGQE